MRWNMTFAELLDRVMPKYYIGIEAFHHHTYFSSTRGRGCATDKCVGQYPFQANLSLQVLGVHEVHEVLEVLRYLRWLTQHNVFQAV